MVGLELMVPFVPTKARQQSFNGLSNTPSGLVVQMMPSQGPDFDPEMYSEFGASCSVLVLPSFQARQPAKRKSKFGFASLLDQKTTALVQEPEPANFLLERNSRSEARHEVEMGMHYGNLVANAEAGNDMYSQGYWCP